tara:strand:- start:633 stop:1328 length:696 start_codon:yes stop_codon:yes gene_type:complete
LLVKIESLTESISKVSGTAIVIDVLRAFSTAVVAFEHGVEKIIMVEEVEQALDIQKNGLADISMGEVDGIKPDGFNFGNSPFELSNSQIQGATVVQSTRAGTTGVEKASKAGASTIFAASLMNASATSDLVKVSKCESVTIFAMGAWGTTRSDEDEQCALYIRNLLQGRTPDYQSVVNLVRAGEEAQKYGDSQQPQYHPKDLDIALNIDSANFAIRIEETDGLLVAKPVKV